jgi:hypothetical protein
MRVSRAILHLPKKVARCRRCDKRAVKIAMQHLLPYAPGENLFAQGAPSNRLFRGDSHVAHKTSRDWMIPMTFGPWNRT